MNTAKNNSHAKRQNIPNFLRMKSAFLFVAAIFCTTPLDICANPTGGQIAEGSGSITTPSNHETVVHQTSDKMVIDWRSFNIAAGEKTQFVQPSEHAIAVNRVDPNNGGSIIAGKLSANGNIWIINPAGIAFSQSAKIDVAGLLATTADISNADFMNGKYHFTQSSKWHGSIVNAGSITVADKGIAALVAPNVANSGVIKANLGKVILAASDEYTLDFYGDHLIEFGVYSKPTSNINANSVNNDGKIITNGGTVIMTAQAASKVIDDVVSMKGFNEAKSATEKNDKIVLSDQNEIETSKNNKDKPKKSLAVEIENEDQTPTPTPVDTAASPAETTTTEIPIVTTNQTPVPTETPVMIANPDPIALEAPTMTVEPDSIALNIAPALTPIVLAAPITAFTTTVQPTAAPTVNLTLANLLLHNLRNGNLTLQNENVFSNNLITNTVRVPVFSSVNNFSVMKTTTPNLPNNFAPQGFNTASDTSVTSANNSSSQLTPNENRMNQPVAENSLKFNTSESNQDVNENTQNSAEKEKNLSEQAG